MIIQYFYSQIQQFKVAINYQKDYIVIKQIP